MASVSTMVLSLLAVAIMCCDIGLSKVSSSLLQTIPQPSPSRLSENGFVTNRQTSEGSLTPSPAPGYRYSPGFRSPYPTPDPPFQHQIDPTHTSIAVTLHQTSRLPLQTHAERSSPVPIIEPGHTGSFSPVQSSAHSPDSDSPEAKQTEIHHLTTTPVDRGAGSHEATELSNRALGWIVISAIVFLMVLFLFGVCTALMVRTHRKKETRPVINSSSCLTLSHAEEERVVV